MEIIIKGIDEIRPYENNPRVNDGAVGAVAESIREFGFQGAGHAGSGQGS